MAKPKTETTDLETLGTINVEDVMGECARLAGVYGRESEKLLGYTEVYVARKAALEKLESELEMQTRKSASISGEKVTDKSVTAAVESTPRWCQHKAEVDEAKNLVDRQQAILTVLSKKEHMLDILGRFHIREYTATQTSTRFG